MAVLAPVYSQVVLLVHGTRLSQQNRGIYNKCVCDSDLQRDRTGYTDLEQKVPAAVFFCGLVTVVVAALLGLQGNSYISAGLDLMFISKG